MHAPLLLAAVLLDRLLGEPRRWHPLVGFGAFAARIEKWLNRSSARRARGLLGWALAVLPLTALAWLFSQAPQIGWVIELGLLYLAIGFRSLWEHAQAVAVALRHGDLPLARTRVGYMVSRQTDQLSESDVAKATTESVLENGSDAVFAALFWFLLLGGAGAVIYRLANTLDAMWGYRNERYLHFGWAAARLDDLLNYVPARLVALTYALCGNLRQGISCWREQAPLWDSPNAGPVMAAGAGALGVRLGGAATYHGELHERPVLGCGSAATGADIDRALRLVRRGVALWVIIALTIWGAWNA